MEFLWCFSQGNVPSFKGELPYVSRSKEFCPENSHLSAKPVDFFTLLFLSEEVSSDLPASREQRVEQKRFYFDVGSNPRGVYLRISEVSFSSTDYLFNKQASYLIRVACPLVSSTHLHLIGLRLSTGWSVVSGEWEIRCYSPSQVKGLCSWNWDKFWL